MMTTLEKIHDDLHLMGVEVIDCRLKANTSIAFEDGYIGVDTHKLMNPQDTASQLGHEAGHFYSGLFYHVRSKYEVREQVEFRASRAMWFQLMPPQSFIEAHRRRYYEAWELAEWFEMPERDVVAAQEYYLANGYI